MSQRYPINSNKKTHEVTLRKPHSPKQEEMIFGEGNIVALCGRQFGKTDAGVNRIFVNAIKHPGSLLWWVGLAWTAASLLRAEGEIYRISSEIITAAGQRPEDYINRTKHQVDLPNGSRIWLRTAERPESLAGEGIHGVVIDEFTLMNEEVWSMYLTQTLMFYSGWALFVGVPRGNNWGARLWRRAQSLPGWRALTATTYENPFMPKAQIESRKRELTERMYRQEIMAEIIDDAGAVFRGILQAATGFRQDKGISGHTYVGGLDVARLHDFTVLTIIDVTLGEVCFMDRFSQLDFDFQEMRVKAVTELFPLANLTIEETGLSMQMAERLGKQLNVTKFKTGNNSKDVIIQALSVAIQQPNTLKLLPPDDPVGVVAIAELQAYTMEQMAGGAWKYGAPSGENDDTVMSLALALYGMGMQRKPPRTAQVDGPIEAEETGPDVDPNW